MVYRQPIREEKTIINRALDRWGVFDYFKVRTLMVDDNVNKTVCLLSGDLESILPKTDPDFAGMPIGQLTKHFSPSMPGADLFARVAKLNQYYVTVAENAEKLILYGRDVMGESILECSKELDENEIVILLNHRGEAIGVGRTRFAGRSLLTKGKITITTILDAGMYLRDEG